MKGFSVERDAVWEEQRLQALFLFEGGLDPDVGGTGQDLLCEGENAFNVDLLKLRPVTINPRERELLTQMVPMTHGAAQDEPKQKHSLKLRHVLDHSWDTMGVISTAARVLEPFFLELYANLHLWRAHTENLRQLLPGFMRRALKT